MTLIDRIIRACGTMIRENHTTTVARGVARVSDWYLACYWNQQYWNMHRNGELLLLSKIGQQSCHNSVTTILDVGANKGDYSRLARATIPNSVLHCFEIVPRTRQTLSEALSGMKSVMIAGYGLSNADGDLEIVLGHDNDERAHVQQRLEDTMQRLVIARVITGDRYISECDIKSIDLLKVDTEGHDMAVLEGFKNTLSRSAIRAIQFEYGTTWIAPKRFLHEAYALLESNGFRLGRLHPDGVVFKSYDKQEDEHFRMGNYVAVHESCRGILESLSLRN